MLNQEPTWAPASRIWGFGLRVSLPPLPSIAGLNTMVAVDPAQRMHAAIREVGVAHLDLRAPFEAAWMVPVEGGRPLYFSHATGNRLVAKRLLERHPMDCRDTLVARYIPASEPPLSDEEIEAEVRREIGLQMTLEKRRLEDAKARGQAGRPRYQRKRPGPHSKFITEEEARERYNEGRKRRYALKVAADPNRPAPIELPPDEKERRRRRNEAVKRCRARKAAKIRAGTGLLEQRPAEEPNSSAPIARVEKAAGKPKVKRSTADADKLAAKRAERKERKAARIAVRDYWRGVFGQLPSGAGVSPPA